MEQPGDDSVTLLRQVSSARLSQPSASPSASASAIRAGQSRRQRRSILPSEHRSPTPAGHQQPPSFLPVQRMEAMRPGADPQQYRERRRGHRTVSAASPPLSGGTGPRSRGLPPPPVSHADSRAHYRGRRRGHRYLTTAIFLIAALVAWPIFLIIDSHFNLNRVDALSATVDTPGTTYLLAGSDSRADGSINDGAEGQRADSIMLIHIAPNGQASTISLPRDTYVELPSGDWDKLNASYAYGSAPLLVETVESLTGLNVDHYLEIGMGGVGNIVDAVGGVELCLDMDVNDELSGLAWQSGCHQADGATALAFSRMRYSDPLGDIGRTQRQRQVVSQTVKTAMAPSTLLNPVSALRLERAGSKALTVDPDTSVIDIGHLLFAFRQANQEGLTGAPPIASLNYETSAGSAVLLVDDTAPDFFESLRQGNLTPADFQQDLL